ncbi:MAG: serpin family protein [Actinomycetota bacterium]
MRRLACFGVLASLGVAAACGGTSSDADESSGTSPEEENTGPAPDTADTVPEAGSGMTEVPVAVRAAPTEAPEIAGQAISEFGFDLFEQIRSDDDGSNVIVSPASVSIALAMVEPGTNDLAQEQMRTLLGIDDPETFHASMNALEVDLESRTPAGFGGEGDPGEITIDIANAAFLQMGYPFEDDYLDTIGTNYGPVLREVDFEPDPDAVGRQINDFVADATNDQITDLIADGTIEPETVLALVNALYLNASWLQTFDQDATTDAPFTLLDGSRVDVPLMNGTGTSSAAGDGWVGATKAYVGGLSAQFILPDEGRFDEIASDLGSVVAEYDANRTDGAEFSMPRFETRTSAPLGPALQSLGLTAPFQPGGLLGIAGDPLLLIDQVVHEAFVAIDEDGTEAAAATVVLMLPASGPVSPPVPVVLDRPFLFRIVDDTTGATLFIGQITDPSGSA